jgi:hypothetical protein
MKNNLFYISILILAAMNCSDKIAGGSGAGNPGATTFAIVSVTDDKYAIPDTLLDSFYNTNTYKDTLFAEDDSSGRFALKSAELKINRIVFLFDSTDKKNPGQKAVLPPLLANSEGIVLEGPFAFNILSGESKPNLPVLTLPEGKYRGVRLEYDTLTSTLELQSLFIWKNSVVPMKIAEKFSSFDLFKNDSHTFNVHNGKNTSLKIVLNASKWFKGTAIISLLNDGQLHVDEDGTLYLGKGDKNGNPVALSNQIANNLKNSGKLIVRQTNASEDDLED